MESKPLSSLYLCGDDSEENTFGGLSSFDSMDLDIADNFGYSNVHGRLSNNRMGMECFPGSSHEDNLASSSSSSSDACSTKQPSILMNDTKTFISQNSSSEEDINSGSLVKGFDKNILPVEKISYSDSYGKQMTLETLSSCTKMTNSFVDLPRSSSHYPVKLNSDINIHDGSASNFPGSSTMAASFETYHTKQESQKGSARRVVNGEISSNEESDELDYDENLAVDGQIDGEELNEEDEDMEEECDDEEDSEDDEEEETEEATSGITEKDLEETDVTDTKTIKEETSDQFFSNESKALQNLEGMDPCKDAQNLPSEKECVKKPKKKKKKLKLDSDVTQEGEEKPKKKRRRRDKGSPRLKKAKMDFGIRRSNFERKNIRKILDDNLDEETKAAQKEEMERKQRLLEIQEKLRQQALELRAQREKEMLNSNMEKLKNSALKSLLEEKAESPATGMGDLMRSHGTMIARPQKAPDVVEISSSDEEEDNDIIMMSEEEEDEEDEEDPENSGSHVNDALNRPDSQGCVLVNVGHPPEEPEIFLAPQLASVVKPHQIGGIRFLYDNVVENLERYKTSNGFGCILAHSMGLGKTIQVIAFIDIFLRHTGARSALIIVPVNTLQNWINEFNMWLPTVDEENRASIDSEILWPREFKLYVINDNMKLTTARAKVVADWHQTGGVLLLGYEMYRLLIKTKGIVTKPKRSAKKTTAEPLVIDVEEEECNKELVKGLHEALMRPGPDLVICDEGHRIKNSHASISQVLKNIRTRRRVVLTGYPLQNNLLEYWCMVDFVRPNYLGTKTEFCNMFERPIMNGQCVDSTPSDVKLMRFRAHVLHSLLEGFVQRRGHTVLQSALPLKEEYVLFIRMSPIQRKLYNEFMSSIKDSGLTSWNNSNNPIKAFSVCCKIWNHPDILYQIVEQRKDDIDLDIEETKAAAEVPSAAPPQQAKKGKGKQKTSNLPVQASTAQPVTMTGQFAGQTLGQPNGQPGITQIGPVSTAVPASTGVATTSGEDGGPVMPPAPPIVDKKESQVISYDWATDLMKDYIAGVAEHSGKMVILLDIIEESVTVGDKILVFSQSLFTLSLIEEYLSKRIIPGTDETWMKNRNYFRLDGSTSGIDREKLINQFNDDSNNKFHLFLLSTRAGCLGINLVGASRVVIFDASWNPCHDCQAVCRVYRYGQTKCCYVYRLVTDNTMEKNIYDRQINKQGISDRVVDELNPQNLISRKQADVLTEYQDADLPTMDIENYDGKCTDVLLGKLVKKHYNWVTKEPFTHEALLLDRKDQKLTKHEKRLAKQGYEMEKKLSSFGYGRPSYSTFYPKNADGMPMIRSVGSKRYAQRPVASVRPMMSNPLARSSAGGPFQNRLMGPTFGTAGMKPGVSVQQVQTTTDIIIPPTNTSSDSAPSKIPAGEKVLIIRTPKGVYIRTSHGKIFAVRTTPKPGTTASGASAATATTSAPTLPARKVTASTATITRVTSSTTVSFVSTITGSTTTNTQSTVKSMTSSATPTSNTSAEASLSALTITSSAFTTHPIPSPVQVATRSATESKPPVLATDVPVRPVQQQLVQQQHPPRIPVLPAVVSNSSTTKAGPASGTINAKASAVLGTGGARPPASSAVGAEHPNPAVAGIAPSISSFTSHPQHQLPNKSAAGSHLAPALTESTTEQEPIWDRAPDFDELLSDSDDLNSNPVHSAMEQNNSSDSFYHGYLGGTRNSPALMQEQNDPQTPVSRGQSASQSASSSKAFLPVDRTTQNIPPRHPMPMAPPYLPPTMSPYGMPSPYPWMPSMPMWMQPMGPMGRIGMDPFQEAFSTSENTDFGNDVNFDDLGSDDRSFSSLLLGNDSDDMGLGRRGTKAVDSTRSCGSGYRQNTSMPYSSGMGGYPYHPYPYNMPQGGYYPPPPHHAPSASSQGSSSSMNRGYIPMHYPAPMSASHMGMHPGYMPPPGMMPSYDMSSSIGGRNTVGKKNDFDMKDN